MCGFVGFIETSAARRQGMDLEAAAARMADTVCHRGPDEGGSWADPETGVAFGHRRLSVVELSASGSQPMFSGCGRYVLSYNGEIYNFRELRETLASSGSTFRGGSDTEVLLAAITRWGFEEAIRRCVGMFAFALWDREERTLYLCRDRIGEKPLYYGWAGSAFLFGSELKALRQYPGWSPEIDQEAVGHYLRFCYVPAPLSIYRGIRKLLPGTFLRLDRLDPAVLPEPISYWSARTAMEAPAREFASDADAVEELDRILRDAISHQMVADVPVGAFLSGGVDSSTVVGIMQAVSSRPVRTFTIGFHEEGFDEAAHAAHVARHIGTDHSELYVTPAEAMAVIPRLPTLYDEPFADSSQIPTFLVSELARSSVTVSLSGDGGDELFGGYLRYISGPRVWESVRRVPRPLRQIAGRAVAKAPSGFWKALESGDHAFLPPALRQRRLGEKVQKLARIMASDGPEEIYRTLVSAWDESAIPMARNPRTEILLDGAADASRNDEFTARMMYLDLMTYLPDDIMVKVDRAAMGVSLETRAPMLDHRVVEFALRLPRSMKIRGGEGKWLLRQVLDRYVPRKLIDRPKAGFAVPVGEWIRGPLRGWAEDLLSDRSLEEAGLLPAPIHRYWREHLTGARDRSIPLWCVLMLQAWRTDTTAGSRCASSPITRMSA